MRTYLMENIETIITIEDAVRWSEHYEHTQTKIPTPRVSALTMEEMENPEGECHHAVEAFGRETGGKF